VQVINSAGQVSVFNVEVASTIAAINRGLMYRQSLGSNAGMLFLMGGDSYHTFTMVNMNFPLDIIFINSGLTIVNIAANAQPGTVSVPSGAACAYVLEINGGKCGALDIRTGDHIRIGPYSDPATPTPAVTPVATSTPVPTPTVKPSGSPTPAISPHDNLISEIVNSVTPTPVPTSAPRTLTAANVTSRPVFPSNVSRDNLSVTTTPQPSVSSSPAGLSPLIIPALAQAEDSSVPDMAEIPSLAGLDMFIVCIGLIFVGVVSRQYKK
jgi:uncharacterized membrane protein (UPF0127 family)